MIPIMVVSAIFLILGAGLFVMGVLDREDDLLAIGAALCIVFFTAFTLASIERYEREWKCAHPEAQLTPDARQE